MCISTAPQGGGGGTPIITYIGMCHCEGMVFKQETIRLYEKLVQTGFEKLENIKSK